MSNRVKALMKQRIGEIHRAEEIKLRKHLNADALFATMRKGFAGIRDHRAASVSHTLADTLMAGFAVFSLKDPSLLAFDERRISELHNLTTIYGMGSIPCDTSLREILDPVDPDDLRPLFKDAFRQLQRGKLLEKLVFLEGAYLLNIDGTGYFSSDTLNADRCLRKTRKKTGQVSYLLQMVAAAVVHPDYREVFVLPPETIRQQDGDNKKDCERSAVRRFLAKLRQDHPHLQLIVNEDALSSNGPHIDDLETYNLRYILGVKEGDHKYLFTYADEAEVRGESLDLSVTKKETPHLTHSFRIVYDAPLNKTHQDKRVTFVEYWQKDSKTGKTLHFSWITDLTITEDNVYDFMRGARARWKIENETFNTLKNQGYHLEHNYGLGKEHLSEVLVMLMMLAFLVDQIQQMCCPLFRAVWKKYKTKRSLWEKVRSMFTHFSIESMEDLYRSLLELKLVPLPR